LADYRDAYDDLTVNGIDVVALSVDDEERAEAMRRRLHLPYLVLCDPSRRVLREWGLLNKHKAGGIAIPATVLLDRDRAILYFSRDTVTMRTMPRHLLTIAANTPIGRTRTVVLPRLREWRQILSTVRRFGRRSPLRYPHKRVGA
jgi:peroxiredoxin